MKIGFLFSFSISKGDLREVQPKAVGSSILYQLTNELALDLIRLNGMKHCRDCFVAPVATGMAMALCLSSIRPERPQSKYVIWSRYQKFRFHQIGTFCKNNSTFFRIDQKSCFKAIITAGYIPIVLELVKYFL